MNLAWIIANWKSIAAVIATAALAFLLHTVDVYRIDAAWQGKLDAQKTELEAKCKADKQLTEESSRGYQDKIDSLTKQLGTVKRLHPSRCVVPVTREAAGSDGKATAGKYAGQDGVDTDALYDYAGSCERLRLQVISLQDFINQVWAAAGQ